MITPAHVEPVHQQPNAVHVVTKRVPADVPLQQREGIVKLVPLQHQHQAVSGYM